MLPNPGVNALITLGEMGMLLLLEKEKRLLHARLRDCKPDVWCAVGAGDAALAGILFELDCGKLWEGGALQTALAAASAAVELPGTEAPTKEDVAKFAGHVDIQDHEVFCMETSHRSISSQPKLGGEQGA